ncbi:kinesin-like protein KIN-5B [Iris pallida]|uniref:Kinesin-like protein KIN-5B n=1 Tax=Iris pallida TaxID=29817 RepID=A0AAX6HQ56_IRIPA|nr:kinesin-like protein KIN-5B [Iris pallida]
MSVTPNPSRRLGFSLAPSPAPFLTPRSERRPPPSDLRWADGGSGFVRPERDREVNVQVVLRCRPLSDEEQKQNVQKVISCNEQRKEVTVLQGILNRQADKSFSFDKVFGPKSQQRSIYDHAISPIVNDVLEGFNCTVFAYGQTGTGKTYTMEGGMKCKGPELPAEAGVIPRAVRHIFDTLEARKADYSMQVTFLELYNEEITDLLAPEDQSRSAEDNKQRKSSISLMEDGKGGAVIRGLQEEVVYSANEIYKLLEHGAAKRRSADTQLNKQSSRSHSVFSITIHVKEVAIGNEELIKCGRLNLVDLAGSENISRSGAREVRAREAGEVNKSLLTLGRVITALVEHSVHIPYRDSKLTRLLRESLGGKAKTCIIATISPSIHCLEESLSTLDYAFRAKSIRNKPEANQKLSKSVLLKDLYLEMERMKQDVRAAREKNGVYIPHERFVQDEAEKTVMREKIRQLELDLELKRKEADQFQELYHAEQEHNLDTESELKECKANIEDSRRAFQDLQEVQKESNAMLQEKEFVISSLLQSEHAILERAKELHTSLENASEDMSMLLTKIERQENIGIGNKGLVLTFGSQLDQSLKSLHKTVIASVCEQHQVLQTMEEHLGSFIATKCEAAKCLESRIERMKDIYHSGVLGMKELAISLQKKAFSDLEQMKCTTSAQIMAIENFLAIAITEAEQVLDDIQRSLAEHKGLLAFSAQQQQEGLRRSLASTQVISKTTINFFDDLRTQTSRLMKILEENQMERSCKLDDFEKKFKELSAKEEKEAIEKIAGILTNLAGRKLNMVSEAVESMNHLDLQVENMLQKDVLNIQQVSDKAKNEWMTYTKQVERQFQKDVSSTLETRATMENILQNCSEKVGQSMLHLENAKFSIEQINRDYAAEIESSAEKMNQKNGNFVGDSMSLSSHTDVEFETLTCDVLTTVSNSLSRDHGVASEMESVSSMCSDHLKTLQGDHSERIKDIRNLAETRLLKEYLVDYPTNGIPAKNNVQVPSLGSIEALRTTSVADLVKGMRLENGQRDGEPEGKHRPYTPSQIPRNPFTPVNIG